MNQERLMKVLLSPVVSEKPEIREAVELMFDVRVTGVQVANVRGKTKRFGQTMGRRVNWKKAYVTLAEGHDIDFMGKE